MDSKSKEEMAISDTGSAGEKGADCNFSMKETDAPRLRRKNNMKENKDVVPTNIMTTVKLFEYIQRPRVVGLDEGYKFFPFAPEDWPDLRTHTMDNCCTRMPIIMLQKTANIRIVIGNRYCFMHAMHELHEGNQEIVISIMEVKNVSPDKVFFDVVMDSLHFCPLMRTKPNLRVDFVQKAFALKEQLKKFFDVSSRSTFFKVFSVPDSTATAFNKIKDPVERDRIANKEYKERGNAAKRKKSPKVEIENASEPKPPTKEDETNADPISSTPSPLDDSVGDSNDIIITEPGGLDAPEPEAQVETGAAITNELSKLSQGKLF